MYDPLCGWCFGFGPVLLRLFDSYRGAIDFDVVSGGMITGNAVGPLSNMADFISKAYPVVEQHSGVKFGAGFLQHLQTGTAVFSSLEPGNVLTLLKELQPGSQVQVSHDIQHLIYVDGINPVEYAEYRGLFEKRGLNWHDALLRLKSSELSQTTVREFGQAQKWGIQGFPACLVQQPDGKLFGISRGFLPFEEMEKRLQPFLS